MTVLPLTTSAALINFVELALRKIYNQYQLIGKLTRKNKLFKKILVKYGLFKLIQIPDLDDYESYTDNITPLGRHSRDAKIKKFIDLLITQDASVCIAQEFLMKFVTKLYDRNATLQTHLYEKLMPIIIRDINTAIQDHRHDPMRQIREAFSNKNINLSQRHALQTRKYVCISIA